MRLMLKRIRDATEKQCYLCADGDTEVIIKSEHKTKFHSIWLIVYELYTMTYTCHQYFKLVTNALHQYLKLVTKIFRLQHSSPISQTCHQNISSTTHVTNISSLSPISIYRSTIIYKTWNGTAMIVLDSILTNHKSVIWYSTKVTDPGAFGILLMKTKICRKKFTMPVSVTLVTTVAYKYIFLFTCFSQKSWLQWQC